MLTQKQAAEKLSISVQHLNALCLDGRGPIRSMGQIKTEKGFRSTWMYEESDLESWVPTRKCRSCKKTIPANKSFCDDPECRRAYSEKISEAQRKRGKHEKRHGRRVLSKEAVPYECKCPKCKKTHTVHSDVDPGRYKYCPVCFVKYYKSIEYEYRIGIHI